jgi:hypothetical protein
MTVFQPGTRFFPTGVLGLTAPSKVYHGTDVDSAADIEQNGLRRDQWDAIIQQHGGDTKGFSLSADPGIAEMWAATQAALRAKTYGVVLEAEVGQLPLLHTDQLQGDPSEFFIEPDDFSHVGPGVFKWYGGPVAPLGISSPHGQP